MRYVALASDYDGTLAKDGQMTESTLKALERLRNSGRKLILVTGRHIEDLCETCQQMDYFDCVVAENGALLYWLENRQIELLGEAPSEAFLNALKDRQVDPFSPGHVIVSSWEPNETKILETIRDLGLELNVIFNKGAVMILPAGINKASGLKAALDKMKLSPHNVIGVGDAENDHAFMDLCEFSVAVNNALPALKEKADWVTSGSRGEGVEELIEALITSDLATLPPPKSHLILIGTDTNNRQPVNLMASGSSLLLAGTSGSGKSTLATAILEQLHEQGYQFCIIDPEGDYESFENAVVIGNAKNQPNISEIQDLLEKPDQSVVLNLLGVPLQERPSFFRGLLPMFLEMRSRTGRPHWLVIDETHHLLPTDWNPASLTLPQSLTNLMLITVHPNQVSAAALSLVNTVIAFGKNPDETIKSFCQMVETSPPEPLIEVLEMGEGLAWFKDSDNPPIQFKVNPPKMERHRHRRNYAEGNLGEDKYFYFRGPDAKLNLAANNVMMFLQLAAGVDDETWVYHLQNQDYSRWLREAIKDEDTAEQVASLETESNLPPDESRAKVRSIIEEKYTLPA